MHRDEQVRLRFARALHALLQRHEGVAAAGQHRAHAGLGADALGEHAGDRERDVLLVRAVVAGRAGIDAAVAGVDGDQKVARRWRDALGRWRRRRGVRGDRGQLAAIGGGELDDQVPSRPAIGGGHGAGAQPPIDLEHEAQAATLARPGAHGRDGADAGRQAHAVPVERRGSQVDDHAGGVLEREHRRGDGAGEIELEACPGRGGREFEVDDLGAAGAEGAAQGERSEKPPADPGARTDDVHNVVTVPASPQKLKLD